MRHGGWMILVVALCLLAVLAMGRCQPPARAAVLSTSTPWPSWTPRPTATIRVYSSWTPLPSATSRRTATRTATKTATPTPTIDLWATSLPTATPRSCFSPWIYSQGERYRIQAAAVWALSYGVEEDLIPYNDMLCGIGLYENDLGCPMTTAFVVEGDVDGAKIRVRGFALGIVAVMEQEGLDNTCQAWGILTWRGEARE